MKVDLNRKEIKLLIVGIQEVKLNFRKYNLTFQYLIHNYADKLIDKLTEKLKRRR